MTSVLILYGTTEGQTAKIAKHIGETLQTEGHSVITQDGSKLPRDFSLEPFDAIIIGASVHYGGYQKYVKQLIQKNLDVLRRKPTAFFSVSGAAASPREQDHRETEKLVDKFIEETSWRPAKTEIFGGAILYTQYSFFKRLMMKVILKSAGGPTDISRDHELTDWNAVTQFAEEFSRKHMHSIANKGAL